MIRILSQNNVLAGFCFYTKGLKIDYEGKLKKKGS